MMRCAVILPAAGASRRFAAAADLPAAASKVEMDLAGRPVFHRAIELFLNRPDVGQVILAVSPDGLETFRLRWGERLAFLGVTVVPGGRAERWETVLHALQAVSPDCTHVAVHDAARPIASQRLIDRVFEAAQRHPAVIPGLPAAATLKRVEALPAAAGADPLAALLGDAAPGQPGLQRVAATVDRRDMIEVQTPQVFELGLLRRAYEQIAAGRIDGAGITDDAMLVERLGEPVVVVEGDSTNIKITRPEDLELVRAYVSVNEQKQAAAVAKKRLFPDEDEE